MVACGSIKDRPGRDPLSVYMIIFYICLGIMFVCTVGALWDFLKDVHVNFQMILSFVAVVLCTATIRKIPLSKIYLACIIEMFISLIVFECGLLSGNVIYVFFLISGIIVFAAGMLLLLSIFRQKTNSQE